MKASCRLLEAFIYLFCKHVLLAFVYTSSSLQVTSKERLSHKSKVISELEDEIEKLQGQIRSAATAAVKTQSENKENSSPKNRIENKKEETVPTKSNTVKSDKTAEVKTSQVISKKV